MDEAVTVVLQIDTFRGGIGREQYADGGILGGCLEGRLYRFALLLSEAAMEQA
ncbi:hypothetical protein D3C75_1381430 [compost metagenome]